MVSNIDLDILAAAWRSFSSRTSIEFCTIKTRRHYGVMIDLLNELVDEIGDQESHALMTGPKPGPLLYDFTFPPLYLSEVFGAPIESIAKSHNAHCDKENLARTCFGKK